jgi:hypothetical protein
MWLFCVGFLHLEIPAAEPEARLFFDALAAGFWLFAAVVSYYEHKNARRPPEGGLSS